MPTRRRNPRRRSRRSTPARSRRARPRRATTPRSFRSRPTPTHGASVKGEIAMPMADGLVDWQPQLVFPGLAAGETLARQTRAPQRADILAADGTPLAEGPAAARSSPIGASASAVTGTIDTARGEADAALRAEGFPPRSLTGTSGLELAFNDRLDGQPERAAGRPATRRGRSAGRARARGGRAGAREAGQDHARPRSPGGGGRGAGRAVRRRRCTGRPRRLGEGAGGDRVLLAAAARIDLQGDHHLRGARGRAGEDDRRVPRRNRPQ